MPNGRQRLAALKLKTGDIEGAIADFRAAVANGADPNQIANAIFSLAYSNHYADQTRVANHAAIDVGELGTALELLEIATEFVQDPALSEQIHFYLAYGYYLQGSAFDGRNEADEACAPARSALNAFERVSMHLGQAGSQQAASQRQIREAIDVQLYRQQQIIESSCDSVRNHQND